MRSALSGECVLPPAGARRYEANYRGIIEGEHWAQCARVRRQREERTLEKRQSWGPSNDGGLRMVSWESQSKTSPGRKRFSADSMARPSTCSHGKCTMPHRGDTRFAPFYTPALPSCSQIACSIHVDTDDVDKALCVRVHVHCMRASCLRVSIVRACPVAPCAKVMFARGCCACLYAYI